jgi:hypothetical protein
MALLDAPEYDPRKERRRNIALAVVAVIVIVAGVLVWLFRNWPEEHAVNQFLSAVEQKQFEKAYGLWYADPDWKQHPQKYPNYSFNDFMLDWGPTGEFGTVKSHDIKCSARTGSGVVVAVSINGRVEPHLLWVETKDKSITDPPGYIQLKCQ